MTIPIVSFQHQWGDARGSERVSVQFGAVWLDHVSGAVDLNVLDVSASGFLLETDEPLPEKTSFIAKLPDGVSKFCRIVWSSGRLRGAKFSEPLEEGELQRLIIGSAGALADIYERSIQSSGFNPDSQFSFGRDYADTLESEKLPFAVRLRIIFGSVAILWGLIAGLIWSLSNAYIG